MKNLFLLTISLCIFSNASFGAQILYKQSFEKPIAESPEIQWSTEGYPVTQAIVDYMPQDGQKSVRGNFNPKVIDPITKLQGYNFVQLKLNFKKIPQLKEWHAITDKIYVSWWFKHDPCHWKGANFANNDPLRTSGKIAYLRSNEDPAKSYYFGANGGQNGLAALTSNGFYDLFQLWYDRPTLWVQNNQPWGATGKWHKISFLISKEGDQKYLTWWIDGALMKADRFEPSGRHKISNIFIMDSIQFWHTIYAEMDGSTESPEEGVCNGWQIDNVEIWDDIPSKPLPPTPAE